MKAVFFFTKVTNGLLEKLRAAALPLPLARKRLIFLKEVDAQAKIHMDLKREIDAKYEWIPDGDSKKVKPEQEAAFMANFTELIDLEFSLPGLTEDMVKDLCLTDAELALCEDLLAETTAASQQKPDTAP